MDTLPILKGIAALTERLFQVSFHESGYDRGDRPCCLIKRAWPVDDVKVDGIGNSVEEAFYDAYLKLPDEEHWYVWTHLVMY